MKYSISRLCKFLPRRARPDSDICFIRSSFYKYFLVIINQTYFQHEVRVLALPSNYMTLLMKNNIHKFTLRNNWFIKLSIFWLLTANENSILSRKNSAFICSFARIFSACCCEDNMSFRLKDALTNNVNFLTLFLKRNNKSRREYCNWDYYHNYK
jgi:hypothetical protein